ncbi:surface antigen BspA-like [Mycoplasma sp. CAG:611]|nr:surface antigen BspA-like [Mycoplasma sp. CAG:611]
MKKVISFFKTDIKIINSYFLFAIILIILISVGYTSYALFSFTKTSSNVIEGKVGKINYTTNFEYTGECTTYIAKSDGYYNLEVWGAQGGNYNTTYVGGLGGYSKGIVHLTKGTTLYVCVGGQPQTVTTTKTAVPGGFNGGGNGFNRDYNSTYTYGQAGGGATDIRIGQNSLYARVIVAGGGSGSNNRTSGYAGGGTSGVTGQSGYAGTQTSAGTGGSFGQGGSASTSGNNYKYGASGGGGGFYGGGAGTSYSDSTNYDKYSGGGSGYVYTSSTASSYPSGCLLNNTYYLTAASTTEGINTGNGKATITYIGKEIPLDTSGANTPILASNMIPVYYDETNETWKKADANNKNSNYQWYSYESSGDKKGMWANAVTVKDTNRQTYLNADVGTTIPMDDITTMWVWIPRFKVNTTDFDSIKGAKGCSDPSYLDSSDCAVEYAHWGYFNIGAIDVTFVKQNETAIDAFTFGDKELSGFWYGKFEIGHTTLASSETADNLGCTNETCSNANGIIIKPNVKSLRFNSVSNFFFASRSMEQSGNSFGFVNTEVDTHMSKNNEWGAVAYLTQSIYGRCMSSTTCIDIGINNNSSYKTGYGAPAGSFKTDTNGVYNTTLGKDASTTGTIYGIYDMSGGATEYVMGVYSNTISNSGFSSLPDTKYYNNYTGTSYTGHALTETQEWYSDYASFVNSSSPWFMRSGNYGKDADAGVFYFYPVGGNRFDDASSRLVISNK